jgi:hypothetical protein
MGLHSLFRRVVLGCISFASAGLTGCAGSSLSGDRSALALRATDTPSASGDAVAEPDPVAERDPVGERAPVAENGLVKDAAQEDPPGNAQEFMWRRVRAWPPEKPELALAVSDPVSDRVSSYDNALLALYFMRTGQRPLAGKILAALGRLQRSDGSIPFTFAWPKPEPHALYVRTGAVAWVGVAANEYLDSEAGGAEREAVIKLAHLVSQYLIERQVGEATDARDGLVLGGYGTFVSAVREGRVHETYLPGYVEWAATEHNIDAYFFLRDFARITGKQRFADAAERIAAGLRTRFMPVRAQLVQGVSRTGTDRALALDCASWGALFWLAAGDPARAARSLESAERHFASREEHGVSGHRPYARSRVIADPKLATMLRAKLPAERWDDVPGVWAEGSAGVALAALRLGHVQRARDLIEQLDRLRTKGGGLPTFTMEIPFVFDAQPSLAGTVWVELVRDELGREDGKEMLWRRR